MTDDELAKALFKETRSGIPSAADLAILALQQSSFASMSPDDIKKLFSDAVSRLQIDAYRLYLAYEKDNSTAAIQKVFSNLLPNHASAELAVRLIAERFSALDRFSLSLTQGRRSRAGTAFEVLVSELFSKLGYPYTAQPTIAGNKPDYVLPSIEWYEKYPADSIIFTLKRTLRERWRQIVTESSAGRFYLATIDDKVSGPGLDQMMVQNITVVVPKDIKVGKYPNKLNVISFEDFFEDHLDPAMLRWKKTGAI